MLSKVIRPDGEAVKFQYDALGRRLSKRFKNTTTKWLWDGNVPLHEWKEHANTGKLLEHSSTTWVFEENSFIPAAKLKGEKKYSILADHLGTPKEMYDEEGEQVWNRTLDSNGKVKKGTNNACPFLFQGQYYDAEIGLAYNRFRYYDPEDGRYISQDPIGLLGGFALYGYVENTNYYVDVLGWSSHSASNITFTDSNGTTLTANGYTDLSHLSDTQLKQIEYMNTHKNGKAPVDKQGNPIVAHHNKQQAGGPIVMMPAKHYDKPHTNPGQHPNGKRRGGGLSDAERKAFNNWRKEFYANLAKDELDKRKKNSYKK